MESVAELLQAGLAFQQQKKFKEAESVYRRVLEGDPNQSDALHLLGLVRSSLGNPAEAIEWIEKAIRVAPNSPVFYSNLGVMLRQAGKIPEAIEAYLAAINLAPEVADTHFNLGKAYKMQGDLVRSEDALLRSIALNPRYLSPWLSLIGLEVERHRYAEGIEKGKQALQLLPNNIELLMSVGAVFKRNQQNEEALELYRRALALSPDHVDLLCRIGSTLITQQRIEEGETYIERAARHDPTSMHVLNAYGLLHNTLGDSVAGAKYLRDSIQRYPHHAPSYCNLSNALRKLGNLTEALEVARKGVELDANNVESRVIEAGSLLALGELEEANATLRKAIQLKGGYKDAHDTLLMCMHYQPTTTVASLLAEHLDWDSKYARPLQQPCSSDKGRSNGAKIRIGFTSGDLGAHPVGYFVVRLLESIDRSCFETYVYSDRVGEDWLSKRISQSVDAWKTTCGISDADLTTMIRGDKVDVLFDLSGHTAQNRLLVFARRAAPVQISWAGYVGTTGLQAMDYLLADPFHVPREMEPFLAEKVLRMPNGYVTFLPPEDAPDVGPLPMHRNQFATMGAMCNPAKVNESVLDAWARILTAVPNSKILLAYGGWTDPTNQERVRKRLKFWGLNDRVQFDFRTGSVALMALYNQVDFALDTFPYSGGLTTCEALWMGVPTVTFPGKWFAGRHSFSHMMNVGLPQFIANDVEDYVAKGIYFAGRPDELAVIRNGLREQMSCSPLCDGPLFARNFEGIVKQACTNWAS